MPNASARSAERTRRPAVVTVAAGFAIAAAAVNTLIAAFLFSQAVRGTVTDPQGREAPLSSGGVIAVVVIGVIALLFSAGVVVLAIQARRGRLWTRTALFATALVSVAPVIVSVSLPALLVVLLLVIACVLLYLPSVTRWHRALRGLPPG